MPKVSQSVLVAFGKAVKRARSLRGWQLDQLSAAMPGSNASRSYLSNLEKGQRQISSPTVGRLIKALDLDESWIDRFLDADVSQEAEETPVDRETERLLTLNAQDSQTPQAAEDLLILLANTHAQGQYTDTFTAYEALRAALEAAERIRQRGEMQGNSSDQLDAVMAEVAALNAKGELDEADKLLDAEHRRMMAAHRASSERHDAEATALLERRLDQDRLRNDPEAAAHRLIRDLHRQAPPGGVWRATSNLLAELPERGRLLEDPFDLRVALALAKANCAKAKGPLEERALFQLGSCRFAIGERAADDRQLRAAEATFRKLLERVHRKSDPGFWAAIQGNIGGALQVLGKRTQDDTLLRAAVAAYKAALGVQTREDAPEDWANSQNNLGVALQSLGERTRDDALLREAVEAYGATLSVWTQHDAPLDWAGTQNNLGGALRWRGTVTRDTSLFDAASAAFARCQQEWRPDNAPFRWATTQWNLADLALARFALTPDPALLDTAERHVTDARAVFATGSEYQTARCDTLLDAIRAARDSD